MGHGSCWAVSVQVVGNRKEPWEQALNLTSVWVNLHVLIYVHLSQLPYGSWQKCGEVNAGKWLYAVSEEYGDSDFLRDPR